MAMSWAVPFYVEYTVRKEIPARSRDDTTSPLEVAMKKRLPLVALMALMVASLFGLAGCGGGPSAEEQIKTDLAAQFDAVTAEDEALIEGIDEAAGDEIEQLGLSSKDFMTAYLDGFAYKIGEIEVDEEAGTAVAKVTVTIKSMGDILSDFQTTFMDRVESMDLTSMTEDDLYKEGGKVMMEVTENTEAKESEVEIGYSKNEDGEWEIDDSAEAALMNAMMS